MLSIRPNLKSIIWTNFITLYQIIRNSCHVSEILHAFYICFRGARIQSSYCILADQAFPIFEKKMQMENWFLFLYTLSGKTSTCLVTIMKPGAVASKVCFPGANTLWNSAVFGSSVMLIVCPARRSVAFSMGSPMLVCTCPWTPGIRMKNDKINFNDLNSKFFSETNVRYCACVYAH